MSYSFYSGFLGALVASAVLASDVVAAPVYWFNNPNNSIDIGDVTLTKGSSDKGLFGDPTASPTPNSFYFFPNNFSAESANGVSDITSDRLSFTVTSDTGEDIRSVFIRETGDWLIDGLGSVQAFGTMYVTKLAGTNTSYSGFDQLDVTYTDSQNNLVIQSPLKPVIQGGGQWDGLYELTLPTGITSAQVVLNNILTARTSGDGLSTIFKKVIGNPDGTDRPVFEVGVVIPEPTSLALLALGGLSIARRRRSN